MTYAVGGITATIYLLLALILLYSAIQVSDLALCSDPAGVAASGEDDCIDTSSAGRVGRGQRAGALRDPGQGRVEVEPRGDDLVLGLDDRQQAIAAVRIGHQHTYRHVGVGP